MIGSHVVTGGGQGIGRAVAERLLSDGDAVVALDRDEAALGWTLAHPAGQRVIPLAGDAADEAVTERAAGLAREAGRLAGWVNNAAVFRDAWLEAAPAAEITALITANLALVVAGCAVAVRGFLAAGSGGAIVNVSSHQAQRPVRGALPYSTAKAAIEGLTRALAVDYGPRGIRVNAVALGTIATGRYEAFLASGSPAAARAEDQVRALHPLGRAGRPAETADAVRYLLSDEASFVNGAVLAVDGGRSVLGPDRGRRSARYDLGRRAGPPFRHESRSRCASASTCQISPFGAARRTVAKGAEAEPNGGSGAWMWSGAVSGRG